MGTVSPEQARDFYRASASFYRQAPWRTVGEGETIKIQCQQLGGGPWYAVILGKMINIKGLMLFDDREGRRLMQRAKYELIADRLSTIAVHYEDAGQAHPDDVAAVKQHGFEVAGPNAYPLAFRMENGPPIPRAARLGAGAPGSLPLDDPRLPQAGAGPQARRLRVCVRRRDRPDVARPGLGAGGPLEAGTAGMTAGPTSPAPGVPPAHYSRSWM